MTGFGRRYPPLLAIAAAVVLAVFALPSALNLPQANPGTIAEYAPLPSGSQGLSAHGNLAGLGLGEESQSVPAPPVVEAGGLAQAPPSTKQCVGNPPRQTEDPLSPPCVGFWTGDNGGTTYAGVTRTEVRILFYLDGNYTFAGASDEQEQLPSNRYFDLGQAPQGTEPTQIRGLRVWQAYYNNRYQTYGRRVHFFAFYNDVSGGGGATSSSTISASQQRANAAANEQAVHPFAVFNYTGYYPSAYADAMAAYGVLSFGGSSLRTPDYYRAYRPLIWGYPPSTDQEAAAYASFVCTEIVHNPVAFSGSYPAGAPRRLGLLYENSPAEPELAEMAGAVRRQVQACGGTFTDSFGYDWGGSVGSGSPADALNVMAAFKQDGITTIVWPGGWENNFSSVAAKTGYLPEWVVADDGIFGVTEGGAFQDQQAWSHAVLVTPLLRMGGLGVPDACVQAVQSVDPAAAGPDIRVYCYAANSAFDDFWDDIRQLFTGIQVAGPKLSPATVEEGFRAIPPHSSSSPVEPACYYDPGDYTCVKDFQVDHWDPAGSNNSGYPGCWRMIAAGSRFRAGGWPSGDPSQHESGADPCNTR